MLQDPIVAETRGLPGDQATVTMKIIGRLLYYFFIMRGIDSRNYLMLEHYLSFFAQSLPK
jgi:hypothetical protein